MTTKCPRRSVVLGGVRGCKRMKCNEREEGGIGKIKILCGYIVKNWHNICILNLKQYVLTSMLVLYINNIESLLLYYETSTPIRAYARVVFFLFCILK